MAPYLANKMPFFLVLYLMYSFFGTAYASKITLLSQVAERNASVVKASEDVLLHYREKTLRADRVTFYEKNGTIRLCGNVKLFDAHTGVSISDRVLIDTRKKRLQASPLLAVAKDDVWYYANKADENNTAVRLNHASLSSCDITDPFWKFYFDEGIYEKKTQTLKLRNAFLYLGGIPVFYTPYMPLSLSKERRSGFLFPTFGYNEDEGFMYEQSFFWALGLSHDLEISPQIRTDRGKGLYVTYRFVDSAYSHGKIRIGSFQDSSAYMQTQGTSDPSHSGAEFLYRSRNVLRGLRPEGFVDGLYLNAIYLDDIEYINLQNAPFRSFGITPLQESKLNYFLHNDRIYFGLNGKYFIDTTKLSNDDTLQILPSLQAHRFFDTYFSPSLYFSADISWHRYSRKEGAGMQKAELEVPLEFHKKLWDDYAGIRFQETFYATSVNFTDTVSEFDLFRYASSIHTLNIYTDLYKKYDRFLHILQSDLTYIRPGSEWSSPTTFERLSQEQRELFSVGLPEEEVRLSVGQYFFDPKGALKFYQRLSGAFFPERIYRFAQIENEMMWRSGLWGLYSEAIYVPEFKKFRRLSTRIAQNGKTLRWSMGHTYKNRLPDRPGDVESNDIYLDFRYRTGGRWDFFGSLSYSLKEDRGRYWRFGGRYDVECWSLEAGIRRDVVPRPEGFTSQDSFYMQIGFIPFATFGTDGRRR